MEFYREKKIRKIIETDLKPVEASNKLSPLVAQSPKWYKFKSPFWGNDKPYEGNIEDNTFYLSKKNYLRIKGVIEDRGNGSVITLEIRDDTKPGTGYLVGRKDTAALSLILNFSFVAIFLTNLFHISTRTAIPIAALTTPTTCYLIWKKNKIYLQKLMTKVEEESKLLTEIFQGKLIEVKK